MLIKEEILFLRNTRDGSRITRMLVFDSEWSQAHWEGRRDEVHGSRMIRVPEKRAYALPNGDHELILVNREQWDKAPHLKPGRYLGRVISHHIAGEEMDRCLADCDDCDEYRRASGLYLMRGESC
jgi:hypothetical protein